MGSRGSLALGFVTGGVGVGAEATVVVVKAARAVVVLGNVGFGLLATVVVVNLATVVVVNGGFDVIVFGEVVAGKVVKLRAAFF